MRKMIFTTNGFEHPHIGYTRGGDWNGWKTPNFEIAEAMAIMDEYNECTGNPMVYEEETDTFRVAETEYTDADEWKGRNCHTEDGMKHLYGIGAYSWTWEGINDVDIITIAYRICDIVDDVCGIEMDEHDIVKQLQNINILKCMIQVLYNEDLNNEQMCREIGTHLVTPAFAAGTMVAVSGNIYEYITYDYNLQMHKLSVIDIDEEGHLTQTYELYYMPADEFLFSGDGDFTQKQWCGIVDSLIRYKYDLTNEEIDDAVADIVYRCFAWDIPPMHKLEAYIAEYMDR